MDTPKPMQFLQYHTAKLNYPEDVLRMRAVLAGAGYMAFEIDLERLWDEFSQASCMRGKWQTLPPDDAELLAVLLVGFGVNEPVYPAGIDAPTINYPGHWPLV
jgi:hypothetical protein